jgi:hypothetical protein
MAPPDKWTTIVSDACVWKPSRAPTSIRARSAVTLSFSNSVLKLMPTNGASPGFDPVWGGGAAAVDGFGSTKTSGPGSVPLDAVSAVQ